MNELIDTLSDAAFLGLVPVGLLMLYYIWQIRNALLGDVQTMRALLREERAKVKKHESAWARLKR